MNGEQLHFTIRTLGVLAAVVAGFVGLLSTAYAIDPDAPTVHMHEAVAYRNVEEAGDNLIVFRYSMPSPDWDSYTIDGALVLLTQSGSTIQVRVPPAKGEAVGAFYLTPSDTTFSWGTSATVTLRSNPALFTNNTSSAVPVQYQTTSGLISLATNTADQAILCNDLRALLTAVQTDAGDDPGTLVTSNTITSTGTNIAVAAFPSYPALLPDCFFVGVQNAPGFTPGTGAFQTGRTTEVEATAAWATFSAFANSYGFHGSGGPALLAALLGLGIAGVVLIGELMLTGSGQFAGGIAGTALLMAGMNAPHYLLKAAFILAALTAMFAGSFWIRKIT